MLRPGAAYGKLPFDRFALCHWSYARPIGQDLKQWNELASRWLVMNHIARSPYHEEAFDLQNSFLDEPRMPSQEQIARLLAPHQTDQERNLALFTNDYQIVRTCYDDTLASAYAEIIQRWRDIHCRDGSDVALRVLDNKALYGDLGDDMRKLFLRMPQLPDTVHYGGYPETEDLPSHDEPPDDETFLALHNAMMNEKLVLLDLDQGALRRKMFKAKYFDSAGRPAWRYWITPEDTRSLEGHDFGLGHRLNYILELSDGDPALREEGAIVEFD